MGPTAAHGSTLAPASRPATQPPSQSMKASAWDPASASVTCFTPYWVSGLYGTALSTPVLLGAAVDGLLSSGLVLAINGTRYAIAHRHGNMTASQALASTARDTITAGGLGTLLGTVVGSTRLLSRRYIPGVAWGLAADLAVFGACWWGCSAARRALLTRTTDLQDRRNESAPRPDTHH